MNWFRRKKHSNELTGGEEQCSFCLSNFASPQMLHGPEGIRVCKECLEICIDLFKSYEEQPAPAAVPMGLSCSFCSRPDSQVKYLVAGPAVYICDECALRLREGIGELR